MAKTSPVRPRPIPQRTCAGCGAKRPKGELVRIVRLANGEVAVDPTRKRPGRGTYLCPTPSCWDIALKRGRLEHALRGPIPPPAREALRAYATTHLTPTPVQTKEA
ncbi:MAG: YlxR family protein [Dehalococcoidia bacterium]|nr:YlxR family protein [Dehalococcoidia bacterium]MDW8119667.1 YlxR family protein [Chloroflexota bacterium]